MMNNKIISILLATYNSELFLEEQLNSIINQKYSNWILYIRDDDSTDNTKEIIKNYEVTYKNIVHLKDNVKKRGATMSFLWLLKKVESDYYMFCDHDDVWLPNKIQLTLNKMLESDIDENKIPIIVHTDLVVVDKNLKLISDSFWKYSNLDILDVSYNNLAYANCITGCTMMINNTAKKLINFEENIDFPHDSWIGLLVSYNNGIILSMDIPTILYRQHENNLIGVNKKKSILTRIEDNRKRLLILNKINKFSIFQYILLNIEKSNSKKIKILRNIFLMEIYINKK
jgi:glycosyltransferase involved in cell wall biosynthesis